MAESGGAKQWSARETKPEWADAVGRSKSWGWKWDGRILVRCLSKDGNIRTYLPRYCTVRIGVTHVLSETNENEYPARTKLHDALFWSPNVTR